jgi:hypothetical protein
MATQPGCVGRCGEGDDAGCSALILGVAAGYAVYMPQQTPTQWWAALGPGDRDMAVHIAHIGKVRQEWCDRLAQTGMPIRTWTTQSMEANWDAYIPSEYREFILEQAAVDGR